MKFKEKILSALAIIFVIAFIANYALVLLNNTAKVVGTFELISIVDENGDTVLVGSAYEDNISTVAYDDEVKIIFDENENFLIMNLNENITGTYEIERTIFWSDSVIITLYFSDDTEIYATLAPDSDLATIDVEGNILSFAYNENVYTFTK